MAHILNIFIDACINMSYKGRDKIYPNNVDRRITRVRFSALGKPHFVRNLAM